MVRCTIVAAELLAAPVLQLHLTLPGWIRSNLIRQATATEHSGIEATVAIERRSKSAEPIRVWATSPMWSIMF